MKRVSVYLAAGFFLAAVAIKLAFPAKTEDTIQTIKMAAVTEQASPVPWPTAVPTVPQTEAVTITINAGEYFGLGKLAPADAQLPEAVEDAVETFLETQAEYEDLGIPADVTYEVPMPSFTFVAPVRARVSSSFGYRVHPLENLTKFHYGTDLAALSGEDILCFAEGSVREVGKNETDGNYIVVDHPEGYSSKYSHCGMIYVIQGQKLSAGEKIGLVGMSGKVTGPHLHFELTKDGYHLNPEFYLAAV